MGSRQHHKMLINAHLVPLAHRAAAIQETAITIPRLGHETPAAHLVD